MNDKNLQTYNSRPVLDWYSRLTDLAPAEKTVFERYADQLAGADVLDIGIGGGRTTRYLKDRCKSYTGIDYSESFAEHVKKKYPELSILNADARDLSVFQANSFDFINFSYNGMDYVALKDRETLLSEIYRVLKPGGIFFFSTHNRSHHSFDEWPWQDGRISFSIKIKTFIKLVPFLTRKLRNQKHELVNASYAIINDSAHNYNLMTFYTSPAFLRTQLAKAGFISSELLNRSGKKAEDELLDDWIFVVTEKK